jgi:hypothetical protein
VGDTAGLLICNSFIRRQGPIGRCVQLTKAISLDKLDNRPCVFTPTQESSPSAPDDYQIKEDGIEAYVRSFLRGIGQDNLLAADHMKFIMVNMPVL